MGSAFEQAAYALVQAMSPSKRLRMEEIPFNSLKDLLADFVGQRKKEKDEEKDEKRNGKIASPSSSSNGGQMNGFANGHHRQPSFSLGEDEDSRMSGTEHSEASHQSANDEESRMSATSVSRRRTSIHAVPSQNSLSSSNSSSRNHLNLSGISLKQAKRAKRLQELRENRRKSAQHEEADELDCNEVSLRDEVFSKWWDSLVTRADFSSLPIYYRLINTLRAFFSRHTWPNSVEEQLCDFLHVKIPQLRDSISSNYDQLPDGICRRVREAQLLALLELHVLARRLGGPEKEASERLTRAEDIDDVDPPQFLNKLLSDLRFIYTSTDATTMRMFLEEPVADTFTHLIPRTVAVLFDELGIVLPADLEEFAPPVLSSPQPSPVKEFLRRSESMSNYSNQETDKSTIGASKPASGLDRLLEELECGEGGGEGTSSRGEEKEKEKEKEKKEKIRNGKRKAAERHLEEPRQLKNRIVPETPEEKLRKPDEDELGSTTIKATPLGKMRKGGKAGAKAQRLSELVRLSEEQSSRRPRAAAVASEKASKAMMQAVSVASVRPTSKESFFSLNTPSPRPQRAKTNLAARFAKIGGGVATPTSSRVTKRACAKIATNKINLVYTTDPLKPVPPPITSEKKKMIGKGNGNKQDVIVKKKPSACTTPPVRSIAPSASKSPKKKIRVRFPEEYLKKFHESMEKLKKMGEKKCKSEAERDARTEAVAVIMNELRLNKHEMTTQRARTGRLIKKHTVHMANIMMNTNNRKPNQPYKPAPPLPGQLVLDRIDNERIKPKEWWRLRKLGEKMLKDGKLPEQKKNRIVRGGMNGGISKSSLSSSPASPNFVGGLESSDDGSHSSMESYGSEEFEVEL